MATKNIIKDVELFELTKEFKINGYGVKLFRIRALVDGKYYKKGEVGGWVKSLKLKSGDARVFGNAWVSGNAEVSSRFDLSVSCNFELKRIIVDTNDKLIKLKDFLDNF